MGRPLCLAVGVLGVGVGIVVVVVVVAVEVDSLVGAEDGIVIEVEEGQVAADIAATAPDMAVLADVEAASTWVDLL